MIKILFMIPNLSVGGAEKVLVNLVNNLDKSKFDVTVQTLFGGGVNEQFLHNDIKYIYCYKKEFRGNSKYFKLFSPQHLYKKFVKEKYDIVVSYLEGPTARIVSGCSDSNTKLVSWIHIEQHTPECAAYAFKNFKEAKSCYEKYEKIVCVSQFVKNDFMQIFNYKKPVDVLYNTNETEQIMTLSHEKTEYKFCNDEINICVVGKVALRKGSDRIVRIQKKLVNDGLKTHFYFLGVGPDEENVKNLAEQLGVADTVTILGYQTNPYKYVSKCNMFVCASLAEGFSTAATEALILGVPIVTVNVSGMKEMLGENNEFGIVTENNEDALYEGIKKMLSYNGMLENYSRLAKERGQEFSTEKTVKAVENMLIKL